MPTPPRTCWVSGRLGGKGAGGFVCGADKSNVAFPPNFLAIPGAGRSVIGIGLGFFGALDRSSNKTYPALGLALNIGILAGLRRNRSLVTR
jgi:hypothetical protein